MQAYVYFDSSYAPCGFLIVRDGADPYSDDSADTTLVQAEVCAGLVKDVPYCCASLLALNVFPRLEGTRDVEFLRAWKPSALVGSGHRAVELGGFKVQQWDTETLAVPGKVTGHTDLVAYYVKSQTRNGIAYVGVFNDPKGD